MKIGFVASAVLCLILVLHTAFAQQPPVKLGSTPATVIRGQIPVNRPPALRVKQGENVVVDTLSHQGIGAAESPVNYFGKAGIKSQDVLPDAIAVYNSGKATNSSGGHILTGPIYVDGAEPGDMLEVRIIDVKFRVPYGVNSANKGGGVLPELLSEPSSRIMQLDLNRNVATLNPEIEIPLSPFMGVMAVAPPPDSPGGFVSSRPPGSFGGNLDLKRLSKGATLYLPVYNAGGQFYTGDAHGIQGDGEVDGTAIEMSLSPTFQFYVHKGDGKTMTWPRAETSTHYLTIGMDKDLNLAMKAAVQETVNFLMKQKGLSASEAYTLASIGVDFHVAEAVNLVQVVYGMIPKSLFKDNPQYWYKP